MAKYLRFILPGAALLAVFFAYANHFQNAFHFDDFHTIADNAAIRDLRNIPKFFTDATTFSVLGTNRTYRPIISTSLALDYWLAHGYNVFWFHLSTFFWFLVQLGAMYALYKAILDAARPESDNRAVALLGTLWYGLHPANAETINYIIQRGDVYSTLGVVAGLAIYACVPQWRKTGLYLIPVILAVSSKPPALVFPVLLFLYILFFEKRSGNRALAAMRDCIPALVVCALSGWLQAAMTPKSYLPGIVSAFSYRITQPYVWLRYFGSFLLPIHLSADTDLQPFSAWNGEAALGVLFVAALAAAVWITARKRILTPIAFGLLWFMVTLLPTSLYPLSEVENDHRMYFAFVGLTLAAPWALTLLVERRNSPSFRRAVLAGSLGALVAYGYGTWKRNEVWRTEESLWRDVSLKSPKNGRGLMNYGLSQMRKGRWLAAQDLLERARVLTPNYPVLQINLGVLSGATQHPAQAENYFRHAIALAPMDYQGHFYYARWLQENSRTPEAIQQLRKTLELNPSWMEGRKLLMDAYADSGDVESANGAARATLQLVPNDADALRFLATPHMQTADTWINRSLQQYRQGQYVESIASAREALKLHPNSFLAYNNLGADYAAMGLWDLAIENIRQCLRINPAFEMGRNNLAAYTREKQNAHPPATADEFLQASLRDYQAGKYQDSISAAKSALRLRPQYAEAYNNMAAAYSSMAQWDEAIAAASEAVRINPGLQLARNNLSWAQEQKKRSAR